MNYLVLTYKILVFNFSFDFLVLNFELYQDLDYKLIKTLIWWE